MKGDFICGFKKGTDKQALFNAVDKCRKGEISLEEMQQGTFGKRYGAEFVTGLCTKVYQGNPLSTGRHHGHLEPTYREYPDKPGR